MNSTKKVNARIRTIGRVVGIVLVVLASIYFIGILSRYAENLPSISWDITTIAALGGASLTYLLVIGVGILIWHLLLKGVGESPGIIETGAIFTVSQFSKYIPGNIAQHVSRLAISTARGWDAARVLLTMIIEASWAVLASSFLAFIALIIFDDSAAASDFSLPSPLQLIAVACFVILIPIGAFILIRNIIPRFFPRLSNLSHMQFPSLALLVLCFMLSIFGFVLQGVMVTILANGIFSVASSNFLVIIGIFAVAWVAGFLTPGAPAGLGIREAILVAGLTPIYGGGVALGVAIAARLVTMMTDGLAFLMGLAASRLKMIPIRLQDD
jgi:uncharacterized membrane protein YbhN (UPF0104 family)